MCQRVFLEACRANGCVACALGVEVVQIVSRVLTPVQVGARPQAGGERLPWVCRAARDRRRCEGRPRRTLVLQCGRFSWRVHSHRSHRRRPGNRWLVPLFRSCPVRPVFSAMSVAVSRNGRVSCGRTSRLKKLPRRSPSVWRRAISPLMRDHKSVSCRILKAMGTSVRRSIPSRHSVASMTFVRWIVVCTPSL
ncbi:MAG: hypothetical protein UZ03_NOB001000574 [Nitrospira sp. OLB3]|nr:MAG: hypothetical protein UZ03_NOB001000574 [Nitrospira sp. OLB3]